MYLIHMLNRCVNIVSNAPVCVLWFKFTRSGIICVGLTYVVIVVSRKCLENVCLILHYILANYSIYTLYNIFLNVIYFT